MDEDQEDNRGKRMKLFFAGGETQDYATILDIAGVTRRLLSYHYMPEHLKQRKNTLLDYYGRDKELFIDSGAYSAFTQGVQINIADYIEFLQFHQPQLYANLDSITSWEDTLKNQKTMEAAGLKPLPAWHAKESLQVLKDYVNSYPYVGIGFGTLSGHQERKEVAKVIVSEFPDSKFHFFAITHLDMLAEYNIYSADSTGWVLRASKFATIDTPFGYVFFSEQHGEKGMYIGNLEEKDRALLAAYLRTFGLSIEQLSTEYKRSWIMRAYYQARFFHLYEEACNTLERKGGKIQPKMLDSFFRERAVRI